MKKIDLINSAVVFIICMTVYLFGITWGMPYNPDGDEWTIINSVLKLPQRHGDPMLYFYGVPYIYTYGLVVGAIAAFSFITGSVSTVQDFAVAFLRDPTVIVVAGRLISALCGALSAVLIYLLGRNHLNRVSSLILAIAAQTSLLPLYYFHTSKIDGMLTFLVILDVWLLLGANGSVKRLICAMLLAGVAVACKLPAVALGAPVAVALFYDLGGSKGGFSKAFRHPLFWASPFIAAAGFFIINPWALIKLGDAFKLLELYRIYSSNDFTHLGFYSVLSQNIHWIYTDTGPVGLLMLFLSAFLPVLKRTRESLILTISAWSYFLLLLTSHDCMDYWLLPILPLFLLSGTIALKIILERLFSIAVSRAVFIVVISLLFSWTAYSGSIVLRNYMMTDTRDLARIWVEKNIDGGTKIAMDTGRYLTTGAPLLLQSPGRLSMMIDEERSTASSRHSMENAEQLYRLQAIANEGRLTYDIYPILHGKIWKSITMALENNLMTLDEYRNLGVKYIITSSHYTDRYFRVADRLDECHEFVRSYLHFYRDIQRTLPVVKKFEPVPGKVSGPVITIYGLR